MTPPRFKAPDGDLPRHDDDFYWHRIPLPKDPGFFLSERIEKRNDQSGFFACYTGIGATAIDLHGKLHYSQSALSPHKPSAQPRYEFHPDQPEPLADRTSSKTAQKMERAKNGLGPFKLVPKAWLGEGGHGFIALCEYTPRKGEPPQQCVVKCAQGDTLLSNLYREIDMMDQFRGAKHLVHSLDGNLETYWHLQKTRGMPLPALTPANVAANWYTRTADKGQPIFLMMEHCYLGALNPWIAKAANNKTPFPDRLLWNLLKCLVQGLIGIAYPNVRNTEPCEEEIPLDEDGNPKDPCHFVHFDIDSLNVFVTLDPATDGCPLFKIADYGMMKNFSPELINQYKECYPEMRFWRQRDMGKCINFTPEQFTMEWDNEGVPTEEPLHKFLPGDPRKPETCGNYGIHTNVFQIGIVMHMMMTLIAWDGPVTRETVSSADGSSISTYGWALNHDNHHGHVDRELRNIVMACLSHVPASRPTLRQLQSAVRTRMSKGFPMDDEAYTKWCQEYFLTPHLPEWRQILKNMRRDANEGTKTPHDAHQGTGKRRRGNDTGDDDASAPKQPRTAAMVNPRAGRNSNLGNAATQIAAGLARDSDERRLGSGQRAGQMQLQYRIQFERLQKEQDALLEQARAYDEAQMTLHAEMEKFRADMAADQAEMLRLSEQSYLIGDDLLVDQASWDAQDLAGPPSAGEQQRRRAVVAQRQKAEMALKRLRIEADEKISATRRQLDSRQAQMKAWQRGARKAHEEALEVKRRQMYLDRQPRQAAQAKLALQQSKRTLPPALLAPMLPPVYRWPQTQQTQQQQPYRPQPLLPIQPSFHPSFQQDPVRLPFQLPYFQHQESFERHQPSQQQQPQQQQQQQQHEQQQQQQQLQDKMDVDAQFSQAGGPNSP